MIRFLKENWFLIAVFALFVAIATAGPLAVRGAATYILVCFIFGYAASRKISGAEGPRRWRTAGRILEVLGPAIGVVIIAQMLWVWPSRLSFAMSVFAGLAAVAFNHWGKQLSVPDALEAMKLDPRPPVVFLRCFKEDTRQVYSSPVGERAGGTATTTHARPASYEATISGALNRIGPFIALGRPGETLATLGAARAYLGEQDWKPFIEATVPSAAAVVLQPEFTPGTLWEVGLVVERVDLRRLLLIVPDPSLRPFQFERVRILIEETFAVAIPTADTCPPCEAFYFDVHRRPVAIQLTVPEAMDAFVEHVRALGPPGDRHE